MIFFALCSIVFFKYYLFYIKMIAIFIDMCGIGCLNSLLCDICIFGIFLYFLIICFVFSDFAYFCIQIYDCY